MTRSAHIARILAVAAALFLAACSDPLTNENLKKLKGGMTVAEVEAIFGSGTSVSEGTSKMQGLGITPQTYVWRSGEKELRIQFVNGKLRTRFPNSFPE